MSDEPKEIKNGGVCFVCIGIIAISAFVFIIRLYGAPDWTTYLIPVAFPGLPLIYFAYRIVRWAKNRGKRPIYEERQREYEEFTRRQGQYEYAYGWQRQREYEQYGRQEQEPPQDSGADFGGDNPFEILGVKESASEDEVKNVYRELSKKWHPDTYPTNDPRVKELATEKFVKIQQAYERIKQIRGWK